MLAQHVMKTAGMLGYVSATCSKRTQTHRFVKKDHKCAGLLIGQASEYPEIQLVSTYPHGHDMTYNAGRQISASCNALASGILRGKDRTNRQNFKEKKVLYIGEGGETWHTFCVVNH